MKSFKNLFFVFVLCLFLIPFCTNATQYSVCKNGCDYDDLDELFTYLEDSGSRGVADITFMDSSEYIIKNHNLNYYIGFSSGNGSNINVSGVNDDTKLTFTTLFVDDDNNLVKLKNLNMYGTSEICNEENKGMCTVVKIETNSMLENVTINGSFSGLGLEKGYSHTINGYTFNGPNYGIVVMGHGDSSFPNRSININNAKLGKCACSLAVYDFGEMIKSDNDTIDKREDSVKSYAIKVDSSEVNCAKYGASNVDFASNPVIYFTANNTWTKPIVKGTLFNSEANVVEEFNSRVVIDLAKKKTIKLNSRVSVQDYFDELKDVDTGDISWRVADPTVLKIENGKVVPLKLGSTDVTATYDNINYTINFRVTNISSDTNNPNTGLNAFIIIAVVIAACALIYPVALQGKPKKS
ncbi:MAG: hypothetical protein IJL76_02595 [Bacilli bacterium]|nr:hypothetical protein [Bacilli bacterium]